MKHRSHYGRGGSGYPGPPGPSNQNREALGKLWSWAEKAHRIGMLSTPVVPDWAIDMLDSSNPLSVYQLMSRHQLGPPPPAHASRPNASLPPNPSWPNNGGQQTSSMSWISAPVRKDEWGHDETNGQSRDGLDTGWGCPPTAPSQYNRLDRQAQSHGVGGWPHDYTAGPGPVFQEPRDTTSSRGEFGATGHDTNLVHAGHDTNPVHTGLDRWNDRRHSAHGHSSLGLAHAAGGGHGEWTDPAHASDTAASAWPGRGRGGGRGRRGRGRLNQPGRTQGTHAPPSGPGADGSIINTDAGEPGTDRRQGGADNNHNNGDGWQSVGSGGRHNAEAHHRPHSNPSPPPVPDSIFTLAPGSQGLLSSHFSLPPKTRGRIDSQIVTVLSVNGRSQGIHPFLRQNGASLELREDFHIIDTGHGNNGQYYVLLSVDREKAAPYVYISSTFDILQHAKDELHVGGARHHVHYCANSYAGAIFVASTYLTPNATLAQTAGLCAVLGLPTPKPKADHVAFETGIQHDGTPLLVNTSLRRVVRKLKATTPMLAKAEGLAVLSRCRVVSPPPALHQSRPAADADRPDAEPASTGTAVSEQDDAAPGTATEVANTGAEASECPNNTVDVNPGTGTNVDADDATHGPNHPSHGQSEHVSKECGDKADDSGSKDTVPGTHAAGAAAPVAGVTAGAAADNADAMAPVGSSCLDTAALMRRHGRNRSTQGQSRQSEAVNDPRGIVQEQGPPPPTSHDNPETPVIGSTVPKKRVNRVPTAATRSDPPAPDQEPPRGATSAATFTWIM